MNIFYAPPGDIQGSIIELKGQEATHASKALRYRQGDAITVVDGAGGWYEGEVGAVSSNKVQVAVTHYEHREAPQPALVLAMGIIKKRDRLEFTAEKAVELGVQEIAFFRSEHSVKQNVRTDRLEAKVLSAMKQSLQCWLPRVSVYDSLKETAAAYDEADFLVAHQDGVSLNEKEIPANSDKRYILFVGPEGGFADCELAQLKQKKDCRLVTLNANRLRAETAAIAFLSICRRK